MTNIYGLYDPRSSKVVMYIGKGEAERAQYHWKCFLRLGIAVNALLRRWFEQLKADGVAPGWLFLEEDVADWVKAERYWIKKWLGLNPALCNISSGGNMPSTTFETCSAGGRAGSMGTARWRKEHPEEARANGRKAAAGYARWLKEHPVEAHTNAVRCGLRTAELHPNWGCELGSKYGSTGGRTRARIFHSPENRGPEYYEHQRRAGKNGQKRAVELHPEVFGPGASRKRYSEDERKKKFGSPGEKHPLYGKACSEERKRKISEGLKRYFTSRTRGKPSVVETD